MYIPENPEINPTYKYEYPTSFIPASESFYVFLGCLFKISNYAFSYANENAGNKSEPTSISKTSKADIAKGNWKMMNIINGTIYGRFEVIQ